MRTDGRNECYDRPPFPSSWVRMEGKGRVAYIAPGHGNEQWDTEFVQKFVQDMMKFVVGKLDLDMTPNLEKECPDAYILKNKK